MESTSRLFSNTESNIPYQSPGYGVLIMIVKFFQFPEFEYQRRLYTSLASQKGVAVSQIIIICLQYLFLLNEIFMFPALISNVLK